MICLLPSLGIGIRKRLTCGDDKLLRLMRGLPPGDVRRERFSRGMSSGDSFALTPSRDGLLLDRRCRSTSKRIKQKIQQQSYLF